MFQRSYIGLDTRQLYAIVSRSEQHCRRCVNEARRCGVGNCPLPSLHRLTILWEAAWVFKSAIWRVVTCLLLQATPLLTSRQRGRCVQSQSVLVRRYIGLTDARQCQIQSHAAKDENPVTRVTYPPDRGSWISCEPPGFTLFTEVQPMQTIARAGNYQ